MSDPRRTASLSSILLLIVFVRPALSAPIAERSIPLADLRDRVEAAWAGKMVGVALGFPTEFKFRGELVPSEKMPKWTPAMLRDALRQDDLYIQMTLAEVLDAKGLDATTADFGAHFRDSQYGLWHAHLAARRLMRRGVPAGEAGSPRHNAHFNDISFQIDADFIGLMSPGMPNVANDYVRRVGPIIGWGQGVPAGAFVSGMYAAAFFEPRDTRAVVEAGLKSVPPGSDYAAVIRDVLAWHREDPKDWEKAWRNVNAKWDRDDCCPFGALAAMNIDARLNGAYVAIGLLYGGGGLRPHDRDRHPLRPGLRLQPVHRRRDPRGDARHGRHPAGICVGAAQRPPGEVRQHEHDLRRDR